MQNNTFSALFVGQNLVKLSEVDSTNNYLKNMLSNYAPLAEGTVIMADYQSAGRGLRDNKGWKSARGKNLMASIFLSPSFLPAIQQFNLNKAISLAVLDYVTNLVKEDCKIKWPNDIYINNQKVAGILIENTIASGNIKNSIIGIGINVNQTDFGDLPSATSIKSYLKKDTDLAVFRRELCYFIEQRYLQLRDNKTEILHRDYLNGLFRLQDMADFIIDDKRIAGKIVNVSDTGALIVDLNGEVRNFNFKEIGFVIS